MKQERLTHTDFPPGFKQWAFWQIDLSLHAPSLDKQLAALLKEWHKLYPSPK